MEAIFSILKIVVIGFFAVIGLLVVYALIAGKRIIKQWEFEAEFRNERGREFGEFEIESSRIDKEEPEFSFKADFYMRHKSLTRLSKVRVYLDELLVLEGVVKEDGRIRLRNEDLQNEVSDPKAGQMCRVMQDDVQLFAVEIVQD